MASMLSEYSCEEFARHLAAKEAVPGGGAASAFAGALGIALGSMVGNFTVGKASYAYVEADIEAMLERAEVLRVRLLELAQEDADAFIPLSKAYGIPKDDPNRAKILESATKNAIIAPFGIMKQVCSAIELLEEMEQKGSRMLVSDIGCGVSLCRSALESASLNVFINTASLEDDAFAQAMDAECEHMLSEYLPRAERLFATVMNSIRGGEG